MPVHLDALRLFTLGLALIGTELLDLTLDLLDPRELLQRELGDLALVRRVQIEELAPRVRQAADLGHATGDQGLVAAGAVLPILLSPFLASAAASLASYTAPIVANSIFNEGAFKDNFSNSWSTSEAAFNIAIGSVTGGIAGNLLVRTGTTINHSATTFLV